MNWPKNVVPAVCVGLFRLFALRLRSVINSTRPLLRSSFASSSPPGLPRSASAARTASVAGANDGKLGKRARARLEVVGVGGHDGPGEFGRADVAAAFAAVCGVVEPSRHLVGTRAGGRNGEEFVAGRTAGRDGRGRRVGPGRGRDRGR